MIDAAVPPRRLQFVLVSSADYTSQDGHALPAGAIAGASLCGLAQPGGGWILSGYTGRPVRIGCAVCREAADRALTPFA